MKKMMFLSRNWYFSVQKALIYSTVNKSHHNSFILLVFWHVANFRYVANFRFLTLHTGIPTIVLVPPQHANIIESNYMMFSSFSMICHSFKVVFRWHSVVNIVQNRLYISCYLCLWIITIFVSIGGSSGYFGLSVRYAGAACREIFGVNTLRGKIHQLSSPNLQDIFIGGKLLWDWN